MTLKITSQIIQHIQPYKDNIQQWTRIGCRHWASPENKYACSQQIFPRTSARFAWAVEKSPKLFLRLNHWWLQTQRVSWYHSHRSSFSSRKIRQRRGVALLFKIQLFLLLFFSISPAFSLFFISEMAILFTSAFPCPPFLLCYPHRPMVKLRSYRFFTWMSHIAHQNHFPCFTSTFENWLSVCGKILNILTVPGGTKDLVIVSARMQFRGSPSSFGSSSWSRQRDAVYFFPHKLLPPIVGGVDIVAT